MGYKTGFRFAGGLALLAACASAALAAWEGLADPPSKGQVPMFAVDASWPKPLPNRWLVGSVIGVSVEHRGLWG